MRRIALGLLLAAPVFAQNAPAPGTPATPPDSAAFADIEATRVRESAAFDDQEAACYQRFAVSGCVKEVQSRRRAMQAGLRLQEADLHAQQFAAQGADQLRRTAEKVAEKKQQDADLQAEQPARQRAEKLRAQQEKQAQHAQKLVSAEKATASATPPLASGLTPAEQAQSRDSYARKLADVEKKRQALAKRLAEQASKPAAPLPLPR